MSAGTFFVEFGVRYSDVDERSVVNNARYLNYFEEARMALLDHILQTDGADFRGRLIVAHAECDYLKPLVLRDTVRVEAGILRLGTKSFDVGYRIQNGHGDPIARGFTTQVHFDYPSQSTCPLTESQRSALNSYLMAKI